MFTAPDDRLYFSTAGHGSFGGAGNPGIWTSTDAQSWEPLELGAPAYLGGVVTREGTVVLSVTHVPEDRGSEFGIWTGPLD